MTLLVDALWRENVVSAMFREMRLTGLALKVIILEIAKEV